MLYSTCRRRELFRGLNRMTKSKHHAKNPRRTTSQKKRGRGGLSMSNAKSFREQKEFTLPLQTAELFAGVGGFHLGLEKVKSGGELCFKVTWGNQWEPSTKAQHAADIYKKRFPGTMPSNVDISTVKFESGVTREKADAKNAPDVDVLVGGFPCQDYSVATTLSQAKGLVGKKGVLWWQIHRFLEDKGQNKPAFLVFENVDRLLKSPAAQRGRDFAIVLKSLAQLGYLVEWRVINAAEYGFAQRRRRVFIVGYHESVFSDAQKQALDPKDWIMKDGALAKAFPIASDEMLIPGKEFEQLDLASLSTDFNKGNRLGMPFRSAGFLRGGEYWTTDVKPVYEGDRQTLGDMLEPESSVPEEFFIPKSELEDWVYLKGKKNEERKNKATGFKYFYTEGPIAFPDPIDKPSRTIITGEGGRSPSRFKHVVKVGERYRRLMPIELERLNGFPDHHTEGVPDGRRAFMMGNALVVGVVEKIGRALVEKVLARKTDESPKLKKSAKKESLRAPEFAIAR